MRLLIVRHGEPDYEHDTLTEKGWREAEYLSGRLSGMDITDFYVSPLGRAKDTASLTLEKMGRTAVECEWLREFAPRIQRPDCKEPAIPWDWMPEDWMREEDFFRRDLWYGQENMKAGRVKEEYEWVIKNFDELLVGHGYVRDGEWYHARRANRDTLVFFCHFGLECVLLSHLMNISPMLLWHHTCALPSSVTTVYTEERRAGKVSFRVSGFGDLSHLYAAGEEPSFAGRFCETYEE